MEKQQLIYPKLWRGRVGCSYSHSSTSYFNYRGEPMGFQYELAQQFARSLGLKLS